MSCLIGSRRGMLSLRLRWTLPDGGPSIESQESTGLPDTRRTREIIERDYCRPISAEVRARRFTHERYLEWFPGGSKAARFRVELGLLAAPMLQPNSPETIESFVPRWIRNIDTLKVRRSWILDYQQGMTAYAVPFFGPKELASFGVQDLYDFRRYLTEQRGLAPKTARNIVNGMLRAMFRHARDEGVVGSYEFFKVVDSSGWGTARQPDPFTVAEREAISEFYETYMGGAFSAFVDLSLFAGTRPSEATALRVGDFEPSTGRLQIHRSRHMGDEAAPKTRHSARTIKLAPRVELKLHRLAKGRAAGEHLFRNMKGGPLNQDNWRKDHWHGCLAELGIRDRVFYCTRHTFISIAASNGMPLIGLARYCGTSVDMIQRHYGRWMPRNDDEVLRYIERAKTGPVGGPVPVRRESVAGSGACPTGFEPDQGEGSRGDEKPGTPYNTDSFPDAGEETAPPRKSRKGR